MQSHCQPSGSSHCHRLGIVEEQEDLKTEKLLKLGASIAKEDADRCHAHIYTAMRSLHMHTCTHTHNLQSDTIAAGDCVDGDDDDDDDDNRPMLNAGFVFSGMAQVVI